MAAWVDAFLRAEGGNVPLADGLMLAPRWWSGPVAVPMSSLTRVCGPEAHMEYRQDAVEWEDRIRALTAHLRAGGQIAPLIVQRTTAGLSVRDGNHRLAALERMGVTSAWVLIWSDTPPDDGA